MRRLVYLAAACAALVLPAGPAWLLVPVAAWLALNADRRGVYSRRPDRIIVRRGALLLGYGPFEVPGELEGSSVVWSFLCVPAIRIEDRVVRFAIWPDSGDADLRRRFRVYVNWYPDSRKE